MIMTKRSSHMPIRMSSEIRNSDLMLARILGNHRTCGIRMLNRIRHQ